MRLPRLLRTSSFRLTLLYGGVFGLCVAVLFVIVAWSATGYIARQIDRTVANELTEVRADAAADTAPALRPVIEQLVARAPGIYYLLQDAQGRVLAGNMPAASPLPGVRVLGPSGRAGRHADGGIRGRGVVLSDGSYLFVGISDFEQGEMRTVIVHAFAAGFAVTIALAILGGLATSHSLLRRIDAMSLASRDIMKGDLGRRIDLRGSGDELDRLAASLNAMLDRIQELMGEVQQVSSDIAHDLRTPLSRLRQRLELALRRDRDAAALRDAVEGSIRDADAILETFAALLRIAQIESGSRRAGFTEVDLGVLLGDVAEAYVPVAEEHRQRLTVAAAPGSRVAGDRQLLAQLFANLIENAIRHAGDGAAIAVTAAWDAGVVRASVADDGPGIPPALRAKVLRRFYRLETSRTTPGSGLGLSVVKAIALLHDADLVLEDNRPGLRCVLVFPALSGPA
ncbi:ATP-binding protein [Acidisphaera rubrifaciens]|uniref:histidine kinase n=1 Tax=Acidisphaera rubrifaciens HS-AP3 TaxID=1231350 RepID=A0A0D6P7F8_9PROT|nr:ATP-binding protein [Acidisphaera rubrifaciens]GAN77690.1 two component sensor histidine kinase [Acidisphaera rubrifaciens HS-AP3]